MLVRLVVIVLLLVVFLAMFEYFSDAKLLSKACGWMRLSSVIVCSLSSC